MLGEENDIGVGGVRVGVCVLVGQLVLIWQKINPHRPSQPKSPSPPPRARLTFYPQRGGHLSRAQLILGPAHVVPLVSAAGVHNFQSVVP